MQKVVLEPFRSWVALSKRLNIINSDDDFAAALRAGVHLESKMRFLILISLLTVSALAGPQATKTDPTARTIRETGNKNLATQDTTADAADNSTGATGKQKSKPKPAQREEKKTGKTGRNTGASKSRN
jgi:hypothetical protein